MTFVAKRTFTARYSDGERVRISRGERLVDDHELARQHPDEFDHLDDERQAPDPNGRPAVRSAPRRGAPRRRMTAEQQQAIRTARLAELEERERSGWSSLSEAERAEASFWAGVDQLLESA